MRDNRRVPTSLDDATVVPPDSGQAVDAEPAAVAEPARAAAPDAVCAAAVGLAQRAAEEVADGRKVGEHLGVDAEGERVATHYFACLSKGYRGWRWAVTVARASRARSATVCEVVLLPGVDAVLSPTWLPWSERLAPGDLGPADQLPFREDDPYLEPGYTQTDDEDADQVALWELGLGRPRVLSPLGRSAAAERWYRGDRGPTADEAVHAAAACSTCGYFLTLGGSLRRVFGVCANEWSPSDGRVVSVDHGCGAHSETDIEPVEPLPLPEPILDELGTEVVVLEPRSEPAADVADAEAAVLETEGAEAAVVETEGAEAAVVETEGVAVDAPVAEVASPESPAAPDLT